MLMALFTKYTIVFTILVVGYILVEMCVEINDIMENHRPR